MIGNVLEKTHQLVVKEECKEGMRGGGEEKNGKDERKELEKEKS